MSKPFELGSMMFFGSLLVFLIAILQNVLKKVFCLSISVSSRWLDMPSCDVKGIYHVFCWGIDVVCFGLVEVFVD